MLGLTTVTKDYKVADTVVHALKGVSLYFRKNEFVSILGPSGCGKTTMLNIIGGLDKYTSGDVSINGVSTRKFRDGDWDVYRNHRIGFIFQSYNLIPHQTVLGNVELALTIAGVGKAERVERAKKALDRVGLSGQYYKRPNQLSGGQCQRVAIARALVNEPEILLADEPTGALDTATSVQIMDLIREIADEKLVIMVTHNPELAERYSTRIIKLLDGEVVGDSNPYTKEEEASEPRVDYSAAAAETDEAKETTAATDEIKPVRKPKKRAEKAKMSLFTSFRLSAQNLLTKKARTILTSIAGAIGIIGVSLVLALSYGLQTYITDMQNDMLSGNPITISESAYDMSALMSTMTPEQKKDFVRENGYVNVNSMVDTLVGYSKTADKLIVKNDITQEYIDYVSAIPEEDAAAVYLNYDLDIGGNVYTDFYTEKDNRDSKQNMSVAAIRNMYISVLSKTVFDKYSSYVSALVDDFRQVPAGKDYIEQQYDVLAGKIATEKDEIMVVLDGQSALSDVLLAQLGYYTQDEFLHVVYDSSVRAFGKENVRNMEAYESDDLARPRFTYDDLMKDKVFTYYPNDAVYTRVKDNANGKPGFYYSHVSKPDEWNKDEKTKGIDLKVVGIIAPKEGTSYGCMENGFYYTEALTKYIIERNTDSEIAKLVREESAKNREGWSVYDNKLSSGVDYIKDPTDDKKSIPSPYGIYYFYSYNYNNSKYENTPGFIGETTIFSAQTGSLSFSLNNMGGRNVAAGISVYPVDFEHKQNVLSYLDKWNDEGDIYVGGSTNRTVTYAERQQITYTDSLSVIINMLSEFINIITIALIGFTALSLVVSSVMIAIITYVSVVERIKEIGVIRSLGGRKRDVSRLFIAETSIIGLASGLIGIAVTYLCSLIINVVVAGLTPVATIAVLPWYYAVMMVGVSVALTLISGVFPAVSAARKDPVVALRSE